MSEHQTPQPAFVFPARIYDSTTGGSGSTSGAGHPGLRPCAKLTLTQVVPPPIPDPHSTTLPDTSARAFVSRYWWWILPAVYVAGFAWGSLRRAGGLPNFP